MNQGQVRFQQLMKLVHSAPVAPEPTLPEHLETRILAAWHAAPLAEPSPLMLVVAMRQALIGAVALMLLSMLWSAAITQSTPQNNVALANYELRENVMP